MEESDACLLIAVSSAVIVISWSNRRKRKRQRAIWTKHFLRKRNEELLMELHVDNGLFRNFTRMSESNFHELLTMIEPAIKKKNTRFRDSVSPEIRLAIVLRFLATGDSLTSLSYLFKVSKQCISAMLPEVLKAIIEALKDYVKLPSNEDQWKFIAENFDRRWNFPHCVGALDGKHVVIQRPENTESEYFNYKGTQSIVLLALVDANYCFTWVNAGCQGRISDGGVFKNTSLFKKIDDNSLKLPKDEKFKN